MDSNRGGLKDRNEKVKNKCHVAFRFYLLYVFSEWTSATRKRAQPIAKTKGMRRNKGEKKQQRMRKVRSQKKKKRRTHGRARTQKKYKGDLNMPGMETIT